MAVLARENGGDGAEFRHHAAESAQRDVNVFRSHIGVREQPEFARDDGHQDALARQAGRPGVQWLAGARHVAVIVLGRHVNPDDAASAPLLAGLAAARYDSSACAVHPPAAKWY